jgi:putative DNA methylase
MLDFNSTLVSWIQSVDAIRNTFGRYALPMVWDYAEAAVVNGVRGGWTMCLDAVGEAVATAVRLSQTAVALASSVWLACRKRSTGARPGWANVVLQEMRSNITGQMRRFWDAGIRGPDFLWAATGPALEAFSRHPVVFREAASDGKREPMLVSAFLREARRLVVEFAVGRVLKIDPDGDDADSGGAVGLDDVTTYHLLHRDSFGVNDAPVGACILYAISCGLSDQALIDQFEILVRSGGAVAAAAKDDAAEDEEPDPDSTEPEAEVNGTGSQVRLRHWDHRQRKNLGLEGVGGRPVPLIDRMHRLMQMWKGGDVTKVDAFINQAVLGRDPMFAKVVQAVIELAGHEGRNDEAVMLQAISIHLHGRAGMTPARQTELL